MAKVALPRYVRAKKLVEGEAYYWEPPHWARNGAKRKGLTCPVVSTPLGQNLSEALVKAHQLNEAFDGWRKGEIGSELAPGTVAWLFAWYQKQRKFTKNAQKTQSDYRKIMEAVTALPMRVGTFGERSAAKIDSEVADKIYDKFAPRGQRQAMYVVQVCRAVWNWAGRYPKVTGIKKGENPWSGMAVSYQVIDGNRPTSREEYEAYCAKAVELGYSSMAAAAALAFELVQRVSDVFGFVDPEVPVAEYRPRRTRGIIWDGFRPGVSIEVLQFKTGKRLTIPLFDLMPDGEVLLLYPELEERLARVKPAETARGLMILEERTGKPYKERRMSTVHRKICDAAGLPKAATFTGFRHGGATEIGDSGESDIRPISGHKLLDTTAIYNQVSQEKARRIALKRREHILRIAPPDTVGDDD
ncbi:MAG: hypothetical protein EON59_04770 [Alphaproteobacteria bacterium]|nr:MAG: hypothetical protein EON59_04770 [Alphaproteobacteria bacterium]